MEGETVWLSQKVMAELFQTSQQNISQHISGIYAERELEEDSTHKKFLLARQEGSRKVQRELDHYNLDMIISVGYRVKSHTATRFRQWATARLKEYLIKGFVLDDERLKNPDQPFDYFDELLRRIQDIRTSEKRFYQKPLTQGRGLKHSNNQPALQLMSHPSRRWKTCLKSLRSLRLCGKFFLADDCVV